MKSSKNIPNEVLKSIQPIATELGYTIWDVEYDKIGTENHLVITIDKEGGIGIDDCETMSRAIDPVLDNLDLIQDEYHLDVSSPGIERNIRTDEHLKYSIGKKVQLKLFAPFEGKKVLVGELISFDDDDIVIMSEEQKAVPRKLISKMNINFEF